MPGNHFFDGKDYYADSAFLNATKGVLPGFSLDHMGFGEFYLKKGDERIDFDRMRGKDFPGQSGRSHKVYDNQKGKLVKKLMKAMEQKGKSKLQTEAAEYEGAELSELQKLAGIRPKYQELLRETESPAMAANSGRRRAGQITEGGKFVVKRRSPDGRGIIGRYATMEKALKSANKWGGNMEWTSPLRAVTMYGDVVTIVPPKGYGEDVQHSKVSQLAETLKLAGIGPKYHEHLMLEKKFQVGDIVRRTTKASRSMGIVTKKEGKVTGYSGKWAMVQWQDMEASIPQAEAGLKKLR
jgi:hypothetical protein